MPRSPSGPEQTSPEIVLEGVDVWIYRGARLTATGHARHSVYDRAAGNGTADDVAFRVAPSGRDSRRGGRASKGVLLDSRRVVGGLRTRIADASGGVTVLTGVGDHAMTPNAHFDGTSRVATGHDGVTVDGPDYRLTAPSFELHLAEEQLELSGGVHALAGVAR